MRAKRHRDHGQLTRRIRRNRRRLGRFVVFAEMEADLRPVGLIDQSRAEPTLPDSKEVQIRTLREQGAP